MCDPGMDELQKTLKRHDRLNELEAFLKLSTSIVPARHWWLVHAAEIRRLLAPFDESIKPKPEFPTGLGGMLPGAGISGQTATPRRRITDHT